MKIDLPIRPVGNIIYIGNMKFCGIPVFDKANNVADIVATENMMEHAAGQCASRVISSVWYMNQRAYNTIYSKRNNGFYLAGRCAALPLILLLLWMAAVGCARQLRLPK